MHATNLVQVNFPLSNYKDEMGNFILDPHLLQKLQAASAEKRTPNWKKRKADGVMDPEAQDNFRLEGTQNNYVLGVPQRPSDSDLAQYQSNKNPSFRSRYHPGPSGNIWAALTCIINICLPANAKLIGLVPHSSSHAMGALYELSEEASEMEGGQVRPGDGFLICQYSSKCR
jgi:hypothetical protein